MTTMRFCRLKDLRLDRVGTLAAIFGFAISIAVAGCGTRVVSNPTGETSRVIATTAPPSASLHVNADEVKPSLDLKSTQLPDDAGPERYLPSGTVTAGIYTLRTPQRGEELAAKTKAAVLENAEWFRTFRAEHKGPLPYDSRLGLTEEEYGEFLALMEDGATLQRVAEESLDFQKASEGEVVINAGALLAIIDGIRIDVSVNVVALSDGTELAYAGRISASDTQKATGRWSGHGWIGFRQAVPAVELSFHLGQHEDSGDGLLYYNERDFSRPVPRNSSVFLHYPLTSGSSEDSD